jgi:HSP20 family molecular chaperone IbpA
MWSSWVNRPCVSRARFRGSFDGPTRTGRIEGRKVPLLRPFCSRPGPATICSHPLRSKSFPTTHISAEDDKQLMVEAHLPNFAEKDVSVNVDQGVLVIQADESAINAGFTDGVLSVTAPFKELPTPHKVAITSGMSSK